MTCRSRHFPMSLPLPSRKCHARQGQGRTFPISRNFFSHSASAVRCSSRHTGFSRGYGAASGRLIGSELATEMRIPIARFSGIPIEELGFAKEVKLRAFEELMSTTSPGGRNLRSLAGIWHCTKSRGSDPSREKVDSLEVVDSSVRCTWNSVLLIHRWQSGCVSRCVQQCFGGLEV